MVFVSSRSIPIFINIQIWHATAVDNKGYSYSLLTCYVTDWLLTHDGRIKLKIKPSVLFKSYHNSIKAAWLLPVSEQCVVRIKLGMNRNDDLPHGITSDDDDEMVMLERHYINTCSEYPCHSSILYCPNLSSSPEKSLLRLSLIHI